MCQHVYKDVSCAPLNILLHFYFCFRQSPVCYFFKASRLHELQIQQWDVYHLLAIFQTWKHWGYIVGMWMVRASERIGDHRFSTALEQFCLSICLTYCTYTRGSGVFCPILCNNLHHKSITLICFSYIYTTFVNANLNLTKTSLWYRGWARIFHQGRR